MSYGRDICGTGQGRTATLVDVASPKFSETYYHSRAVKGLPAEQASSAIRTFVFTDIEGSTRLWEREPERMHDALAQHDAIARTAVEEHRGSVVKMTGDGVHAVFDDPLDAVRAALALQLALADPAATGGIALRVRCGLHAGAESERDTRFLRHGRSIARRGS